MSDSEVVTLEDLKKEFNLTDKELEVECTRKHILKIGKTIKWKEVGKHLLSRTKLSDIDRNGHDEQEKRDMMLDKFTEKYGSKATYKVLIEAMLEEDLVRQARGVCALISPPPPPPPPPSQAGASQPSPSVSATTASQKDKELNLLNIMSFKGKKETFNILTRISTNYTAFGIMLLEDKTGVIVAAIKKKCDSAEDINREIIQKWLQGQGKMPVKWGTLVDVLRTIQLNVLAEDISEALGS